VAPLYYETFKIFASEGHPLLKKKSCTRKDLEGSHLWLLQDGHCFRNQVLQYCSLKAEETVQPKNIHFQSGNLETLQRLVARGHGYTLIPAFMTSVMSNEELKKHVTHFSNPEPAREISMVTHRNKWKNKIVESIRHSILQNLPDSVQKMTNKSMNVLDIC
jgi:LysR family hydrogen peroxide-inducible transcriptional activator